MNTNKKLSEEELKQRLIRFYNRYGDELEQIKDLLEIKLKQICLAYTLENKLPKEAMIVSARKKTLASLIKKFEKKGWPQFYYPTEIVTDLVGARITSWFLDDIEGVCKYISKSSHFKVDEKSVEDYILSPKNSGYRGLHLLVDVSYDSVQRDKSHEISIVQEKMVCEIQIRTKLQDAWGDITHEFHYKAKNLGVNDVNLENFLSDISTRLFQEDKTLMKFRDVYQNLADEKLQQNIREGFKDSK
jgi:putative GTP pyrophosphokinase